jgi:hypothetical protein
MLILVALLILAALIIYDGWSTQYLLRRGYSEGNPLARWMVSKGTWGQILACVVGFSACAVITFLFAHYGHSLLSGVFAVCAVIGEGLNCARQGWIVHNTKK